MFHVLPIFAEVFPGVPATLGLAGALVLAVCAGVKRGRDDYRG